MKLTINGQPIDLQENTPVKLSIGVTGAPTEVQVMPIKTDIIQLPATPNNLAALGYPQELGYIQITNLIGVLETMAGAISGRVVITNVTAQNVEIILLAGNGEWVAELQAKNMRDLDLSEWGHALTVSNIQGANDGSKPYVYDLTYRGEPQKVGELQLTERLPAIKIFPLLIKIFEDVGITVVSDTFQLPEFEGIAWVYNQSDLVVEVEKDKRARFEVNRPSEVRTFRFDGGAPVQIAFFNGLQGDYQSFPTVIRNDEKYWDTNWPNRYIVPAEIQQLTMAFRGKIACRLTRNDPATQLVTASGEPGSALIRLKIVETNSGGILAEATATITNANWGQTFVLEANSAFKRWSAGTKKIQVYVAVEGYVQNMELARTNIYFQTMQPVEFENFVSGWYATGEMVDLRRALPDESQAEFVERIARALDLVFDFQADTRRLRVENRKYYCDGWVVDLPARVLQDTEEIDHGFNGPSVIEFRTPMDGASIERLRIVTPDVNGVQESEGVDIDFVSTDVGKGERIGVQGVVVQALKENEKYSNGLLILPEYSSACKERLIRVVGTEEKNYKFAGALYNVAPKIRALTIDDYVEMHSQGIAERWGKRLKIKALVDATWVSDVLICRITRSLRTPVAYKGQVYRVESINVDADSYVGELQLVEVARPMPTGTGGSFSVPETTAGTGEEVITIDVDSTELAINGLSEYNYSET